MAVRAASATIAGDVQLSYAEHGTRGTGASVVCLPGPTDSWLSYRPVIAHLPSTAHLIAVSQRGHGDSTKPATGYGVEDFAADVVPFLDAVGVERAVLAGHSGSCLTARRVAIDHPDRVAGLVLEASPTTLGSDPRLREFVEAVVLDLADPIDPVFARSVVVDTSSEQLDATLVDELTDELLKVPARVWHEMFASLLRHDDMHELDRITAPALLVWGDADQIVTREMQDALVAHLPDATLRVLAGAGHTPRWEDPAAFTAALVAFSDDVAASRP